MSWDDYAAIAVTEWNALLNQDGEEHVYQEFLERNPAFLPGARGDLGSSGHPPIFGSLIAQPPLQALGVKIPDFMWLATDSETIQPMLIEIERPSKRWFTNSGQQTADLTQAIQQLSQWRNWFENPVNEIWFRDFYRLSSAMIRERRIEPHYVLIYGRRSETQGKAELNRQRSNRALDDEHFMTYDRLRPDVHLASAITIAARGGDFYAKYWPPTVETGVLDDDLREVQDKVLAAQACPHLSAARKQYLEQFLPEWDAWDGRPQNASPYLKDQDNWDP